LQLSSEVQQRLRGVARPPRPSFFRLASERSGERGSNLRPSAWERGATVRAVPPCAAIGSIRRIPRRARAALRARAAPLGVVVPVRRLRMRVLRRVRVAAVPVNVQPQRQRVVHSKLARSSISSNSVRWRSALASTVRDRRRPPGARHRGRARRARRGVRRPSAVRRARGRAALTSGQVTNA
jgi:hypothetical protein